MGRRVILRKRFIRFADFVRHRGLIDMYIPASLLACMTSCVCLIINNRDRGIWAERPSLLPSLLAALLWAWLGTVNLATQLVSCCDLYYNELVSPFFKRTGKRRKRFFSLFVCHRHECQAENVTPSSELPKLTELDWMKSGLIGSSINWPGSTSCWFVLVCDIIKLIFGVIWLSGTVTPPNHGLATSFFIGSLCSALSICCTPVMLSGGEGVPLPCVREY